MAENVSLSAAVRANLLALQSTSELIAKTQGRLSTGLRVAAPVDDPVSFFQAKSLNDRAEDFTTKKRGIDQGISTISAASDAVQGIELLVQQLKGLVLTAKSAATNTEINNLVSQFNDLRSQINNLTTDATYQGLNLVAGTGQTLTVNFSNDTASVLSVGAFNLTVGGAGLDVLKLSATTATTFTPTVSFQATADIAAQTLSGYGFEIQTGLVGLSTTGFFDTVTLTIGDVYRTSSFALSAGDAITVKLGTHDVTLNVVTSRDGFTLAGANQAYITAGTYTAGTTITFGVATAATYGEVLSGITNSGVIDTGSFGTAAGSFSQNFDVVTLSIGSIAGGQLLSAGETLDFVIGTSTFTLNVATSTAVAALALGTAVNAAYITAGTYSAGTTISFFVFTGSSLTISATTITFSQLFTGGGFGAIRTSGVSIDNELAGSELFAAGNGAIRVSGAASTYSAYTGVEARKVVGVGFTTEFNSRITNLDSALTTLRSRAQVLGSNVALLQTRLNFTNAYVNTLTAGAGKLTLADLNEEGANLLALQTRQQLGIQSLAFAGQAEQTILTLFR